jgi:ssDNA-binding Zn-finger/Zn-ribbon topoisomerase 1
MNRCVDSAGGVRYSRARGTPSGQQIRGSAGFFICGGPAECSVSNAIPIDRVEKEVGIMAEKKAKTAEKSGAAQKHACPSCGTESRVTMFAGFGRKGLFWVCDKNCGYVERTR